MTEYYLKDLLKIKNGRDHKHLGEGKIPVYGSGGIMRYANKFLYDRESILLPRKGSLNNIQYADEPFWTVDTIYYSEIKDEIVDGYYLYNYLKLLDLSNLNSGTGVPSMTFGAYYGIKIKLPELKIQKQIAKVLSDLDNKIEINNKINQELESMAKLVYDYWFVQFDFPMSKEYAASIGKPELASKPYKSSGGKMVYNAELKREIPEGWDVGSLLDIAVYTNGIACQKYRPDTKDFLPVIKIKEMRDGFTSRTEKVKLSIPEKVKVFDGDVLFSWSASLEVMLWSGGDGGLNQHIFKVTSKKYPKSFYFFELLNYLQYFKMVADLRKTTMGHITRDHLKYSRIAIPPLELINSLDSVLGPILDKQVRLNKENQKLAELRDWLLPMLMNGQVSVKGTYKEAEDVAMSPNNYRQVAEDDVKYGKE